MGAGKKSLQVLQEAPPAHGNFRTLYYRFFPCQQYFQKSPRLFIPFSYTSTIFYQFNVLCKSFSVRKTKNDTDHPFRWPVYTIYSVFAKRSNAGAKSLSWAAMPSSRRLTSALPACGQGGPHGKNAGGYGRRAEVGAPQAILDGKGIYSYSAIPYLTLILSSFSSIGSAANQRNTQVAAAWTASTGKPVT